MKSPLNPKRWRAKPKRLEGRWEKFRQRQQESAFRRAARKKEYEIYLESDEWKRLRKSKLELAANKCEVCGEKPAGQVHHVRYPERFGQESMDDLAAVCGDCHRKLHGLNPAQRTE